MDTSLPNYSLLNNEQEKLNHLINTLTSFSYVAQVPVTYFKDDSSIAWENLSEKKFCSYFSSSEDCCRGCQEKLRLARETSANLREPYLFLCNAGMVNIAYPFIVDDTIKGAFFAGPIAMGTDRNTVIQKILEHLSYPEKSSAAFITFLSRMETKSPLEISHLHNVFCNCIFSYRILESNFGVVHKDIQNGMAVKTSRFASQTYYPDELPDILLQSIKAGAVEASLRYFRLFYEKAYLMETGNLNLMKVRLTELFHSLSGKLVTRDAASYYSEEIEKLHNAFSFFELYQLSQEFVQKLIKANTSAFYRGDSWIIKKAVDYINSCFSQDISLASVAGQIHTSATYLSTLFKKEMNQTFSQYLTQIRLNNSRKLLRETHLSITEIAMACGFSSQSYFTKIFRETYGLTPGFYRKSVAAD